MGKKRKKSRKSKGRKKRQDKKKSAAEAPSVPGDEAAEATQDDAEGGAVAVETEEEPAADEDTDGDGATKEGADDEDETAAVDPEDAEAEGEDEEARAEEAKAEEGEAADEDEKAGEADESAVATEGEETDHASAEGASEEGDEGEEGDAGEEDGVEDEQADRPPADEPGSDVDAVIRVEEELEDPEARASLIAAAAGLAEDVDDAAGTDGAEGTENAGGTGDANDGTDPDDESGDEAPEEGSSTEADAEEEGEAPLIGPDALVALSEFRDEGVATVPEELVLDLGETTSPDERDRLLAAALAHVEMQDAIYRVPLESRTARRWKGLIAAALFVLALFLLGLPPSFLVPDATPPLTNAERLEGIRTALLMQAAQIEAYRVREERLPPSLNEVDTALPGIRFVRSSDRLYQLVAYAPDGSAVVYDSALPDPAFAALEVPWITDGGDS